MKRFITLLASAAILSACSQKEELEAPVRLDPVEFDTYINQAITRAETTLNDLQTNGFGVFAYVAKAGKSYDEENSEPDFMYNQKVTWNSTTQKWEYTPVKYWPTDGSTVTFIAYAPYTDTGLSANDAKGNPTLNFSDASTDYVTAKIENKAKPGVNEKLTFNFGHAFARIDKIYVRQLIDQARSGDNVSSVATPPTVTVNSLSIKGVETIPTAGATLDLYANSITGGSGTDNPIELITSEVVTQTKTAYGASDMSITQGTAKLKFEYTVTVTDTALKDGKSEIKHTVEQDITIDGGTSYVLDFVIGLTSVKVEVGTVTALGTETKTYDIPTE